MFADCYQRSNKHIIFMRGVQIFQKKRIIQSILVFIEVIMKHENNTSTITVYFFLCILTNLQS